MDTQKINERYTALLASFDIRAKIEAVNDPLLPRQEILEQDGQFLIRLNPSKFLPNVGYEAYAASCVRSILLPRLVLETERLILRRVQKEDFPSFFAFLSDRQSCYDDGGYAPYEAMDSHYFQLMAEFEADEGRYTIVLKDTKEAIGTIHLWEDSSRAVETMEIGYCINPSQRRKGYAFEAVSALVHLLQEELNLELLLGGAFADNTASLSLLKKLGFTQEGILRKALWHVEKGPVDLVRFYHDR